MKTAICDDNPIFLEDLKKIVEKLEFITSVDTFNSPVELISDIKNGIKYDLILMDLDWGGINKKDGLQWSEEIYVLSPESAMIFITGYNDWFAQHVLLANVNLAGYITKPVNEEILKQYIKKIIANKEEPQHIILSRYGNKISINMDEIIYVESKNHKVIVHTINNEYVVYEKLTEVLQRLSKQFIHCHKSFVVNMSWVEGYEGKCFRMKNGMDISISRTYASEAKELFFKYLGDKI